MLLQLILIVVLLVICIGAFIIYRKTKTTEKFEEPPIETYTEPDKKSEPRAGITKMSVISVDDGGIRDALDRRGGSIPALTSDIPSQSQVISSGKNITADTTRMETNKMTDSRQVFI